MLPNKSGDMQRFVQCSEQ